MVRDLEYVQEDEMLKTTKKLDNLMDWKLLNQNNYQRLCKILSGDSQGGGDE